MLNIIIGYYVIVNILLFLVYGWDKLAAKKCWYRIPEHVLLFWGLLGGTAFCRAVPFCVDFSAAACYNKRKV